jgi:radical SAM superfamily enzyme YgiQ (UPF0313 family)
MRVLLISTYELGHQPVHLASPAASLRRAGHDVRVRDVSLSDLSDEDVAWAERVAVSVPMHTATRLAERIIEVLGERRPELSVAVYGLYAGVTDSGVDASFSGEYEPGLLSWADGGVGGSQVHVGRSELTVPDRTGLPGLSDYAHLEHAGTTRLAGAVEASHGCRHRCRHCPIPVVYDGRLRIVPPDVVLADIDTLVAAGAQHITFGDADFLNAPAHSMRVLEAAHATHPDLTFDATIKVSHILEHRDLWPTLADLGLLFVVSAFESVDQGTLDVLDKGHTTGDMVKAIGLVRESGVEIRPTWLPFFPWTTPRDVADVVSFIGENGLAGVTDPVQLSIRLLIPRGSLLEAHPRVTPHLAGYDAAALTWRWEFADPDTELLHKELEAIAANASDCGAEALSTLNDMTQVVAGISGRRLDLFTSVTPSPRLTESWFCCAEPTEGQSIKLRIGTPG